MTLLHIERMDGQALLSEETLQDYYKQGYHLVCIDLGQDAGPKVRGPIKPSVKRYYFEKDIGDGKRPRV
jgi:hypothetical protein